jgi:hypothetical protein
VGGEFGSHGFRPGRIAKCEVLEALPDHADLAIAQFPKVANQTGLATLTPLGDFAVLPFEGIKTWRAELRKTMRGKTG